MSARHTRDDARKATEKAQLPAGPIAVADRVDHAGYAFEDRVDAERDGQGQHRQVGPEQPDEAERQDGADDDCRAYGADSPSPAGRWPGRRAARTSGSRA